LAVAAGEAFFWLQQAALARATIRPFGGHIGVTQTPQNPVAISGTSAHERVWRYSGERLPPGKDCFFATLCAVAGLCAITAALVSSLNLL
jgi:hypothetical protein